MTVVTGWLDLPDRTPHETQELLAWYDEWERNPARMKGERLLYEGLEMFGTFAEGGSGVWIVWELDWENCWATIIEIGSLWEWTGG